MGHILVVDDERSIRLTVKAFLEAEGHFVETAEDADSALAILQRQPMDVALSDIILPRLSGVELLRRIREHFPQVQVVMMTGEPTLETAAEALRLGAVDYLQKPVHKTEIFKAVDNALKIKHLNDEKLRLEEENRNYLNHLEQLVQHRTRALSTSEAALRHRAEELSVLNQLARKVNESLTVDESVRCGLAEIADAVKSDMAVIFLRSGDELVLKGLFPDNLRTAWRPRESHKAGRCLCGLAVREDRPVYSVDIRSDSRCTLEECRLAGFRSFCALPLRSGPDVIGVLGIATLAPTDFQQNAPFIEALVNEMSIGLKKSLLYEQVQEHAKELKASLVRIEEAEAERLILQQHLQRSQKMEAIGTLASGIAHDFNNILGAVIGYAELALLDIPGDSRSRKSLEMVLTAGTRAKDLVKQILAFSRQGEEERKPIEIARIVNEVLKFMRASMPATIEIRKTIGADVDTIMADPVQIHQVLMNLCTNANHAMQKTGGALEVRLASVVLGAEDAAVHPDLNIGPYVLVTVKDSGHGMDAATLEKIFDPYFTTKEKEFGTGLGLSVVHGIVQKHGGAIVVSSEPGKGSAFDLYFPAIKQVPDPEAVAQKDISCGHEHVLLVDDEQFLIDIGRQMLEYLGYTVETRTSSAEALALFKAFPQRFDLVITDLTMPNITGDALARELMRIRADIPVVLCTGYSDKIKEDSARAIGVRGFVMKPILMADLARAVRSALDNDSPGVSLNVGT